MLPTQPIPLPLQRQLTAQQAAGIQQVQNQQIQVQQQHQQQQQQILQHEVSNILSPLKMRGTILYLIYNNRKLF